MGRIYGGIGTIHQTGAVDVELRDGQVVAVWFRCQPIAFTQYVVDEARALSMQDMYLNSEEDFLIRAIEMEYDD